MLSDRLKAFYYYTYIVHIYYNKLKNNYLYTYYIIFKYKKIHSRER